MAHINIFLPQILHNIWLHKLRLALAIFCIAFGVFSVIMLSAIGKGFYEANSQDMLDLVDDSYIVWQGKSSKSSKGYPKGKVNLIQIKDVLELPEVFPEVVAVSPIVNQSAVLSYKGKSYNKSVIGVSYDYAGLNKVELSPGGRFFNPIDIKNNSRVVVINWKMKDILFGKEDAVGKRFLINNVPFTVVGVLPKDSGGGGMLSGDVVISDKSYQSLFSDHQAHFFLIQTKDGVDSERFKKMLRGYFAQKCHFDKDDEAALGFWDSHEVSNFISWFFIGVQIFLWFCGLMILMVGGIGVANIMFLIVSERTYEIGLHKAVGATNQQVLMQIFCEELFMVGIGGCVGAIAAYFMVTVLGRVTLPGWMGVPSLSWLTVLISVIALGMVGLLVGFFPARRASRIDPVEALMTYVLDMLILREIIKELFYERTRAFLVILAVAWGTFAIAITLAIGDGLRLNFAKTMSDVSDKILVITAGSSTTNYRGMLANQKINFTKIDVEAIKSLPNVSDVIWQYNFQTKLRYRGKKTFANLRAIIPEYAAVHKVKLKPKGRFISHLDQKNRASVIMLGAKSVEFLSINGDPVGNTVYVDNRPFKVVGVMQQKPQMIFTDTQPDIWLNWIPAATFELLNNPDKVDAIEISYKDPGLLEKTKIKITKLIAKIHDADPNDQGLVNFLDVAKKQKKVNDFFINMEIFLGFVGGLTLFLAGVGIANVMYASVRRATKEIGVQMALGATPRYIAFRYVMESLLVTMIGGVIGIVLVGVFVYFINSIPFQGDIFNWIGKPELSLSFLVLSVVVTVLGITGILAGLFPALKAAKIDPAEALTYE